MSDIYNEFAYPRPAYLTPSGDLEWLTEGMTLRDYFAGQVLNGLCSIEDQRCMPMDKCPQAREEQYQEWATADANWSYRVANAMLRARREIV